MPQYSSSLLLWGSPSQRDFPPHKISSKGKIHMRFENKQPNNLVNLNGLPLGHCLKLKRMALGWSQKQLSDALGIKRTDTMCRIEKGIREVPMQYRERALEFLAEEVHEDEK